MEPVLKKSQDILLSFHSTSAKQGHFGTRTEYRAAEHRVVYRKWGARRRLFGLLPPKRVPQTQEFLDIPAEISGEDDIRNYVKQHRPNWLRGHDF